MKASGFAAVFGGRILVDTVSLHERAAMVNWLFVYGDFNVPIGMGDFAIREHFDKRAAAFGVRVIPVEVTA